MASPNVENVDTKNIKDMFMKWFSTIHQKNISFLLTGKTGVGKSRLVNALVGKRVAVEGQAKDPCTKTVTSYTVHIEGIEVRIWDSPGLQDGTNNEDLYLEDLTKKLHQGMDVMIYCLKMDDRRLHEDDKAAVRTLTRKFGEELWKNAIIALTFANKIDDPDGGCKKEYFLKDLSFWQKEIRNFFLLQLEIKPSIFEAIPIVPTGNYRELHLPNGDNWLSELWSKCYFVTKDSAALNLYRINRNRVKFPGSENVAKACVSSAANEAGNSLQPQAGPSQCASTVNVNVEIRLPPAQAGPSQTSSQSANATNIPREIPLNHQQQSSFWKKTWQGFKSFCSRFGSAVVNAVKSIGSGFLKLFFC